MIARVWRGLARADGADAYVRHLEERVFPELRTLAGHVRAEVLRRPVDDGVEFVVITWWVSLASIRAFAGDDIERAVVEPEARALMIEFDPKVKHFEVAGT